MSTNITTAMGRESRYLDLVRRRLDLSAEARGTIRCGRPLDIIRTEQAEVEANFRAFEAESPTKAE